jgi:hypothetical protein
MSDLMARRRRVWQSTTRRLDRRRFRRAGCRRGRIARPKQRLRLLPQLDDLPVAVAERLRLLVQLVAEAQLIGRDQCVVGVLVWFAVWPEREEPVGAPRLLTIKPPRRGVRRERVDQPGAVAPRRPARVTRVPIESQMLERLQPER